MAQGAPAARRTCLGVPSGACPIQTHPFSPSHRHPHTFSFTPNPTLSLARLLPSIHTDTSPFTPPHCPCIPIPSLHTHHPLIHSSSVIGHVSDLIVPMKDSIQTLPLTPFTRTPIRPSSFTPPPACLQHLADNESDLIEHMKLLASQPQPAAAPVESGAKIILY